MNEIPAKIRQPQTSSSVPPTIHRKQTPKIKCAQLRLRKFAVRRLKLERCGEYRAKRAVTELLWKSSSSELSSLIFTVTSSRFAEAPRADAMRSQSWGLFLRKDSINAC